MGRRGEMGRCAVVGDDDAGLLCGSGSLLIRPDPGRCSPTYLQRLLSSSHIRRTLERQALGITMLNLNSEIVGSLPIPLPERADAVEVRRCDRVP